MGQNTFLLVTSLFCFFWLPLILLLPLSLQTVLSKATVCGSLSLRLLRTTKEVSSKSLPHNQRNSTPNLKWCHFVRWSPISSSTGNFSLPWVSLRCCLLPYYWGPLLTYWVPQTLLLGLSINTQNPYFSSGSSWALSPSRTSALPRSWQKRKTEAHLSQTHSHIEVFYPSKSHSSLTFMLFFP